MQRNQDWVEQLHDCFLAHANEEFAYGTHDCLLAVCDALQAMTGTDPGAAYRGQYTTELGFMRLILDHGQTDIESFVESLASENGLTPIPVKLAQRGDVVLFDAEEGPAFGIVHLNGVDSVAVGPEGLRRLRTLTARRAWRV